MSAKHQLECIRNDALDEAARRIEAVDGIDYDEARELIQSLDVEDLEADQDPGFNFAYGQYMAFGEALRAIETD